LLRKYASKKAKTKCSEMQYNCHSAGFTTARAPSYAGALFRTNVRQRVDLTSFSFSFIFLCLLIPFMHAMMEELCKKNNHNNKMHAFENVWGRALFSRTVCIVCTLRNPTILVTSKNCNSSSSKQTPSTILNTT